MFSLTPHCLVLLHPSSVVAAAVGLDFTLLLFADGRVFGCGSNENGELGLGDNVPSVAVPTEIFIPGIRRVEEIASGLRFGLYLERGTGRVFGSGSNLFGQLCEDTDGNPVTVPKVRTGAMVRFCCEIHS